MDDESRESRLELAARCGDLPGLESELVALEADRSTHDFHETLEAALLEAVEQQHWDVAQRLLEVPCRSTLESTAGLVLQHAAVAERLDVVEAALQKLELSMATSAAAGRALLCAATTGQLPLLRRLLKAGVNLATFGGEAAKAAAQAGHWDIARELVHAGASLTAPDGVGVVLWASAFTSERHSFLDILAAKGVSASAVRTQAGLAALAACVARWDESLDLVRCLVEHGVELKSVAANTALIEAAKYGDLDMLNLLIERGVDITGRLGSEAAAVAGILGPPESQQFVVDCLVSKGASIAAAPVLVLDDLDF